MFPLNHEALYRSAPLPEVRYWSIADTFIDQKVPEANYGRDQLLSAGPGKVIFLRFEDLARVIGNDDDFDTAQIQLRQILGKPAQVSGIFRVSSPWDEGNDLRGEVNALVGFTSDQPTTGATWRVNGNGDLRPIPEAKATFSEGFLRIDGLAKLVNQWRNGEIPNFGIAITCADVADFASGEARIDGPQLQFTRKKHGRTGNRRITTMTRTGEGVAFTVDWGTAGPITPRVIQGTQELPVIKKGADQFIFTWPASGLPVQVSLPGADAIPGDHQWTLYPGGRDFNAPLADHATLRLWNEVVAPHSRFSFARAGVATRLNHWTNDSAPLGNLNALKDKLGLIREGDRRDDIAYARQLPLSPGPWPDELAEQVAFPESDLLSAAAVGQLNQPTRGLPKNVAIRVVGVDGLPLAGIAKLSVGEKSKVVNLSGSMQLIPLSELATELSGPDFTLAVVTTHGEKSVTVPRSDFFVAGLRAGTKLPVVRIGVPMPPAKLDEGTNLAFDKLVGDEKNSDPAALKALVDANASTKFKIEKGTKWLEINLGRDRVFGSVDILTAEPQNIDKIEVGARETAQATQDTERFGKMLTPAWHAQNWCPREGDLSVLRIMGMPLKARIIRIYFTGNSVEIAEIRVVPARVNP